MNLKIGNLGRFYPLLQAKGITGLVNGSKLDELVWNEINDEHGQTYLNAMFKGETQVRERLLPLDAERYKKGDIELKNLLHKYCAHFFMP